MPEGMKVGRGSARLLVPFLGLFLVAVFAVGSIAVRAGAQGTPPEELSEEELLYRVTTAPEEAPDFSATVSVEQDLVPEGLISSSRGDNSAGSGPRTARVWRSGPEQLRAELQGENGDKLFVKNGGEVRFYDGASNTLTVGEKAEEHTSEADGIGAGVSPEKIDEFLAEISPTSELSTGRPVRFDDRWAYPLTLEPRDKDLTLVEKAEALVDAETYLPLSFELYAEGATASVASYEARDFEVGRVPDERFELETPPGATVEQAEEREGDRGEESREDPGPREAASVAEAQEDVDFPIRQLGGPLADRGLTEVLIKDSEGIVQTYGEGFGTVVLVQHVEDEADEPREEARDEGSGEENGRGEFQVPTVDLGGGVEARAVSTPVGTALSWSADGVSYRLAGSVPAAELEEAARGLLSR